MATILRSFLNYRMLSSFLSYGPLSILTAYIGDIVFVWLKHGGYSKFEICQKIQKYFISPISEFAIVYEWYLYF